jgi:hypothetical protein
MRCNICCWIRWKYKRHDSPCFSLYHYTYYPPTADLRYLTITIPLPPFPPPELPPPEPPEPVLVTAGLEFELVTEPPPPDPPDVEVTFTPDVVYSGYPPPPPA